MKLASGLSGLQVLCSLRSMIGSTRTRCLSFMQGRSCKPVYAVSPWPSTAIVCLHRRIWLLMVWNHHKSPDEICLQATQGKTTLADFFPVWKIRRISTGMVNFRKRSLCSHENPIKDALGGFNYWRIRTHSDHNNLVFIFDPLAVVPDLCKTSLRKVLLWAVNLYI